MTIAQLFINCTNLQHCTFFRVFEQGEKQYDAIYRGEYLNMPYEVKRRDVDCFEFDQDMEGILVVVE